MLGKRGDDETTKRGARARIGGGITRGALGVFSETLLPLRSQGRVTEDNRCLSDSRIETIAVRLLLVRESTTKRVGDGISMRFSVAGTENDVLFFGEFTGKSGNR